MENKVRLRKRYHSDEVYRQSVIKAATESYQRAKAADPEGMRLRVRSNKWKKAGILNRDGSPFTKDSYQTAVEEQRGRCALCHTYVSDLKGKRKILVPDHDHRTKKFRGLLCDSCNKNRVSDHTLESARELVKYLSR